MDKRVELTDVVLIGGSGAEVGITEKTSESVK